MKPLNNAEVIESLSHAGIISCDIPVPQEGLYLDGSLFSRLQDEQQLPHRMHFQPTQLRAIGRENSRNMVFFGDLSLHSFSSKKDLVVPIAVKPYGNPSEQDQAMHEYAMNEHLRSLGINGPRQIGLLIDNGILYNISLFEPEIVTLDSVDWTATSPTTKESLFMRAAETLVLLHANGIFHGDPQLKNFAVQPERNKHWVFDTEYSLSIRDNGSDIGQTHGLIANAILDLEILIESMKLHKIIPEDSVTAFEASYHLVLKPYQDTVLKSAHSMPYINELKHYVDVIVDLLYMNALQQRGEANSTT